MPVLKHARDSVHVFINDLACRIVAETQISTDRYHLGKLIFQSLKDDPEFIAQVDGATGVSEKNRSLLIRSVKCAISLEKIGVKKGDVVILMAPNHLDLTVPLYAALYLGVAVAALDSSLGIRELKDYFDVDQPKVVFCQSEKFSVVNEALNLANVESKIITFDKGADCENFKDFIEMYVEDKEIEHFKPTDFDPNETVAFLTSTSGTTGLPKSTILTHKNLSVSVPYLWIGFSKFPTPTDIVMIVSPLQWLSAGFHFLFSSILRYTRLQCSKPLTVDIISNLINKYKPTYTAISPPLLTGVMKSREDAKCDLTCFEVILIGGSAVPQDLLEDVKKISPTIKTLAIYGLSEIGGLAFYDEFPQKGSVGKPVGCLDYRLVDPSTMEDISGPNVQGELWLRGLPVSKGYYKNPEATAEAFIDGWIRTGDIFYRDEHWNFYFVERMKLLLKYKNHQISPIELEGVIRQHPAVMDVAVTGIPDPADGDLPVACVVTKPNQTVTAQEIKDIVKDSLTDTKHLRGGVIFLDELPMTITTKVHRRKLKEMVQFMERE